MLKTLGPRAALVLPLTLMLAACGSGVDKKLDTTNADTYRASLDVAAKDMSDKDKQAFDWAVQDLTVDAVRQRYPDSTPREIIRAEAKEVNETYPARIKQLEVELPRYDATLAQIKAIKVTGAAFALGKDFFGLQPTITATVHNGGNLPVSSLRWHAELYVDDGKDPVAESDPADIYEHGLNPGATADRKFVIGFVSGDTAWKTLAIQNAKTTRVVLTVDPDSVKDFSNRLYMDGAPYAELSRRRDAVKTAQQLASY